MATNTSARGRGRRVADSRAQRLNERKIRQYSNEWNNTQETNRSQKIRKTTSSLEKATTEVGNKEDASRCQGDRNVRTTIVTASAESENENLISEVNHFDNLESGSDGENNMNGMTIAQSKKDEVSMLSMATRTTLMSLDNSVFDRLGREVRSAWKMQSKSMMRIFQPVVRDKFMPNYKFCNKKICRQIVMKCMARNEIVQTPGMTYDEFVKVTARSKMVSQFFNSQRHHIQSNMRSNYIGEEGQTRFCETDRWSVH